VQEAVRGDLLALVLLVDETGRTVAAVQQRAERLYRSGVGISARSRSEAVSADLESRALRLLGRLGWHALAELQFITEAEGDPVLIDLNGRFYGSLSLALAAGVNLPDLWARQALGLPTGPRREAPAGVGYQWLEGDLRRAVQERRGGLLRDVTDCLTAAPHLNHSMWASDDPLPLVRQVSRLAFFGAGKVARRLAARARA